MKKIDNCVCCGSTNVNTGMCQFSNFVYDRMMGLPHTSDLQKPCKLIHCQDCDYMGSNLRFELEEEARYYQDYFGDEYNNHRTSYEGPGWTQFLDFYNTQDYIDMRRQAVEMVIGKHKHFETNDITSVLDYGGNKGEMIPAIFDHAKKYVLEVSNKKDLVEGVESISAATDKVDLVICAHTLEHVSDPIGLLTDIKKYLKTGGWIYVEVPFEGISLSGSTVHEHINFFGPRSLGQLLNSQGYECHNANMLNYPDPMTQSFGIMGQLK